MLLKRNTLYESNFYVLEQVIGANVKEDINGFSKADFRFKMSIALKKASETEYWIELLMASEILSKDKSMAILSKCKELCRLLNNIVKNG